MSRARTRVRTVGVGATAAAIALATWPVQSVRPQISGDWSWIAMLSYAAQHGLRFGGQVVWSYGPLGFLNTLYGPVLYYGGILLLSWLFAVLVQLLFAATLLAALRRSLPVVVAVVAAVLVLALTPDRLLALGFAWCALALTRPADAPRTLPARVFPFGIGALSAILLLGKLNQGVELAALAVIALAARPARRDALAFTGALFATAAVGWVATGETLADVWPYVRYAGQIVVGYAAAMGTADAQHQWAYAVAPAIAALAITLTWDATRDAAPRERLGLVALCLVYSALNFKEGFVREDTKHLQLFFGDMLVLFAVLPVRPSRRPFLLVGLAAGIVAFGALTTFADLTRTVNPYANARAAADQVHTLTSPARRDAITAAVRQDVASRYAVSPRISDAVGRHTVMLWPYLYGEVAYAFALNLRALPSLEPYATYTPALDRLGATMLASAHAPQRIMRSSAPSLDGRYPTFEAPLATLAILCRYRQLVAEEPWQVLARSGDRCGAQRAIGAVTAAWGAPVAVPAPARQEALVLARIDGADPQGLERVQALLLRPHRRWIALDGARYRFVAATAVDGLLLHAPRRADYPQQFAMAPNASHIAVGRDGGEPDGTLHYTFVEVPIGSD